jgi:N-acetylneuraminic acid mutarotase
MVIAGGYAGADGNASHAANVTDGAAWNAQTNTWHPIAPMPTALIGSRTAVWTGREVLVWSSAAPFESDRPSGEVVLAYDPANNRWRTLPASGLAPRFGAVVVWTGHELVVWGGSGPASTPYDDGARLDPATGTWRPLPAAPVPARANATASWSGREVLLWGGRSAPGTDVGQGAAYNPTTNQWRALPASPLRARVYATSAWTGRVFIVVGGSEEGNLPVPGPGAAAYDPATDTWTALPPAPPYPVTYGPPFTADLRELANAVWTGSAMVVLGGRLLGQQAASPDGVVWTPAG